MFFACHACHPGADRISLSIRKHAVDVPCERHCEHSWVDETTVEDPVNRLICIHCRATKEESR